MAVKMSKIVGRIGLLLLCGAMLHSCLYMLEKKNSKKVDVDMEALGEAFAKGTRTIPVVFLETEGHKGINNKEYWKDAQVQEFYYALGLKEDVEVKGRGNSTWAFPKKPFNIKFDGEHSFLRLPKGKKFCALANWRDRTRIRNAVALEIARQTTMEWTPEGTFVDLVLDGNWYGNFYVTEKVEPEKLGLGKGCFLLQIDDHFDEPYRFHSKLKGLPVNVMVADGIALDAKAFDSIKAIVDNFEDALYNNKADWTKLIDLQSFCDWFLVYEIAGTDEPSDPKGIYMYCREDGVLHAGPCWDFDYHTFCPGTKGLVNAHAIWFEELLKRQEFKDMLKQRWYDIRYRIQVMIPDYIDALFEKLHESVDLDHEIWPYKVIKTNGDEDLSFEEACERLKLGFNQRFAVMKIYCESL